MASVSTKLAEIAETEESAISKAMDFTNSVGLDKDNPKGINDDVIQILGSLNGIIEMKKSHLRLYHRLGGNLMGKRCDYTSRCGTRTLTYPPVYAPACSPVYAPVPTFAPAPTLAPVPAPALAPAPARSPAYALTHVSVSSPAYAPISAPDCNNVETQNVHNAQTNHSNIKIRKVSGVKRKRYYKKR